MILPLMINVEEHSFFDLNMKPILSLFPANQKWFEGHERDDDHNQI